METSKRKSNSSNHCFSSALIKGLIFNIMINNNKCYTKVIKQSNSHWLNYFVSHYWKFRWLQITHIEVSLNYKLLRSWTQLGYKTTAHAFLVQAMLPEGFLFHPFNYWRINAQSVLCDAFGRVIFLRTRLKLNDNAFSQCRKIFHVHNECSYFSVLVF